jgi:hypothetical protein
MVHSDGMAKAKRSLADHRRSLAAAERALVKARNEMRTAFLREGLKTEGLFAKTEFIPRITASEAKRAAVAEAIQVFSELLKMKADPTSSPFAHLAPFAQPDETQAPEPTPAGKPVLIVNNIPDAARRCDGSIIAPAENATPEISTPPHSKRIS